MFGFPAALINDHELLSELDLIVSGGDIELLRAQLLVIKGTNVTCGLSIQNSNEQPLLLRTARQR